MSFSKQNKTPEQILLDQLQHDITELKAFCINVQRRFEMIQKDLDTAELALATQCEMCEKLTSTLRHYVEYDERNNERVDDLTERLQKLEHRFSSLLTHDHTTESAINNLDKLLECQEKRLSALTGFEVTTKDELRLLNSKIDEILRCQ